MLGFICCFNFVGLSLEHFLLRSGITPRNTQGPLMVLKTGAGSVELQVLWEQIPTEAPYPGTPSVVFVRVKLELGLAPGCLHFRIGLT